MVVETIDLLLRVKSIAGIRHEYFDAICEWYKNIQLAKKVVQAMMPQVLEERKRRDAKISTVEAQRISEQIADLEAYLELHRVQIQPAFAGAENGTLESVIVQTGEPDRLIANHVRPPQVQPILTVRPAPSPPPIPATVTPSAPPPTVRPARPRVRQRPRGSCLGRLLVFSVIVNPMLNRKTRQSRNYFKCVSYHMVTRRIESSICDRSVSTCPAPG